MSGNERRPLSWLDARSILERLGPDATRDVVLVGGQALNFWQSQLDDFAPELREGPPLTSSDIDFCGGKDAVCLFAVRLQGKALFPSIDEPTPNTGLVLFVDAQGEERTIDFIDQPYGLTAKEVRSWAIPARPVDDAGNPSQLSLHVMHPVHCMISRVKNTMELPGYRNAHALRQLKVSVVCARAFMLSLLNAGEGGAEAVMALAERIYKFCHDDSAGRRVTAEFGADPFEAVPGGDERLPEQFRQLRLPQMLDWLAKRRAR